MGVSQVKVGIVKTGCIGCSPLLEFLLDERAEREDIIVRVFGTGSSMKPEYVEDVMKNVLEFKPHLAVMISPNAALPGPTKGREILAKEKIPTIIVSDAPAKKIVKSLEEGGFGYLIVEADSMIGARREFLDPTEMALFNSDIIRVLAITGVYNLLVKEIDGVIQAIKEGRDVKLPRLIIDKEKAVSAAEFQNPYAKAKAMAAYEASRKVADLTVEGCFIVKEWERYTSIVAAAHEIMRYASKLADEARELEKMQDSLMRMPHHPDGTILKKRKLIEKPKRPA